MLEVCQHSSYTKKILQESLESIKPQKKKLEIMLHGLSPNQVQ
jgi:hypothetical protein